MKFDRIRLFVIVIGIILVWVNLNMNWGKHSWKGILESDAKGYYAYLPAIFIYNDLNFSFFDEIEKKYPAPHLYVDYRVFTQNGLINKYYVGTAIAQMPFFLIAHAVSYLVGNDMDGYSKWYLIGVGVAAVFYHLLGLLFIAKLFNFYSVRRSIVLLSLIAISFGSNLFIYTISDPGMSHVYSFAFMSIFLYLFKKYWVKPELNSLLAAFFVLGFLVAIRPINLIALLGVPCLLDSRRQFKEGISYAWELPLVKKFFMLFAFGLLPFIQLLIYKISIGHFIVYSYQEEGFNFLDPHFFDILFSYKKGLFLYTPIYFVATFLGIRSLRKKFGFQYAYWLLFFCFLTYIFSSWWMWFYGGGFSGRTYVDYLPFFALFLGLSINELKTRAFRNVIISLCLCLIVVCQIQSYQYRYYDIHYSEMTKEKYWKVFLMRDKLKNPDSAQ